MKKAIYLWMMVALLSACEEGLRCEEEESGNVMLTFVTAETRATVAIGDYFGKLNVMLFDEEGQRVFDRVKTQTVVDDDFGRLSVQLSEGRYWIVAVGHSSKVSATIKSTEMVQFTASEGEKLTDTFAYCGELTVSPQPEQHTLTMQRATAMVRVILTDSETPDGYSRMKFDYTGGSANFNPTTMEGTTKSTQSETRQRAEEYRIYTFPYQSATGRLKLTVSALTDAGTVIHKMVIQDVPVTRNRITTYRGKFFEDGDVEITQSGFGFMVDAEWAGEDEHTF